MNRQRLLKHLFLLMFFIFLMDFLAQKFFWYSLIWYSDVIMHFLSGLWVGMFFLYVFSRGKVTLQIYDLFFKVFLSTLLVGILWEFFEIYIFQYLSRIPFSRIDTLQDIFLDILGALVSMFYFLKIIMSPAVNKVE